MAEDVLSVHAADIRRIIRSMENSRSELELIILRTPTGGVRNFLTEANIHLLASVGKLLEVV